MVSVIALLLALLLPALRSSRVQTKRVVCASNLKAIGIAIHSYLDANNDHLPLASAMPSIGPFPVGAQGPFAPGFSAAPPESVEPVYLADLLKPHLSSETRVFQCPEDQPGRIERPAPNTGKSYFQSERSSYEFRLFMGGLMEDRLSEQYERFSGVKVPDEMLWIMRDYENFHGAPGSPGARRYLYVDGHVTDFEN